MLFALPTDSGIELRCQTSHQRRLEGVQTTTKDETQPLPNVPECTFAALAPLRLAPPTLDSPFSPNASATYTLFPPIVPLPPNSPPPKTSRTFSSRLRIQQPQQLQHVCFCSHGRVRTSPSVFTADKMQTEWWRPACWRCSCRQSFCRLKTCFCLPHPAPKPAHPDPLSLEAAKPARGKPSKTRKPVRAVGFDAVFAAPTAQRQRCPTAPHWRDGNAAAAGVCRRDRTCRDLCWKDRLHDSGHRLVERLVTGCYCQVIDEAAPGCRSEPVVRRKVVV